MELLLTCVMLAQSIPISYHTEGFVKTEMMSTVNALTLTNRQQLFKSVFSRFSGLFGNSATSEDGSEDRDERQRDFDVLSPKAQHKDICGRRFVRQGRIVGGGIASYGEWPWQV